MHRVPYEPGRLIRGNQLTKVTVVTDVQDPKFDLEKYLLQVAKESP